MNEFTSARSRLQKNMIELGIEPKKSLGQNFLVSDFVIDKIVKSVLDKKPDKLFEIGPGLGALTEKLNIVQPTLIELDSKLVDFWRAKGFEVIEGDALRIDWKNFLPNQEGERVILVSNLPYQISSSLVIERSLDKRQFDFMVLMFQKEVAQRIKATPDRNDYGMISVFAQSFWRLETLLEASTHDFFPPPRVASRVLVFERKINSQIEDKAHFLKWIKAAFNQPRKLLASNLSSELKLNKDKICAWLELNKLAPKARPGELSVQEHQKLYLAGLAKEFA